MQVNKIITPVKDAVSNLGSKVCKSVKLQKINKFFEPDGISIAPYAFMALISGFVVAPRVVKARDDDERREILTRDVLTVATLLFAMKALSAGFSKLASKKTGLVLTNGKVGKGAGFLKKLGAYFHPNGGVSAMSNEDIISKYTHIGDKRTLGNFLDYISTNDGDIKKVLTLDSKKGGVLSQATKEVFGNIDEMEAEDIIKTVRTADSEKLAPLIKVLNSDKNPLVKTAKGVNAWLQAGSLGVIVSFLGFGLPAINKLVTNKKYEKQTQKNN
jgi:hypothetical protein